MTTSQWCAIENTWTDHDTAHHADPGGFAESDRVKITSGEFEGKAGLIQQIRNPQEFVIRIPGKAGNTLTVTVGRDEIERIG